MDILPYLSAYADSVVKKFCPRRPPPLPQCGPQGEQRGGPQTSFLARRGDWEEAHRAHFAHAVRLSRRAAVDSGGS
jgi:hypothetical protein